MEFWAIFQEASDSSTEFQIQYLALNCHPRAYHYSPQSSTFPSLLAVLRKSKARESAIEFWSLLSRNTEFNFKHWKIYLHPCQEINVFSPFSLFITWLPLGCFMLTTYSSCFLRAPWFPYRPLQRTSPKFSLDLSLCKEQLRMHSCSIIISIFQIMTVLININTPSFTIPSFASLNLQ